MEQQKDVESGGQEEIRKDSEITIPSPVTLPNIRKSSRPKKIPIHLINTSLERSQVVKKKSKSIMRPYTSLNLYNDFKCDNCGSRYVVNPMRRGNKTSTSKYKAAPRHKIDPETQNLLTLCNACGLKFGRTKKNRFQKAELSEEEQKKFFEEGELFGKDLSLKLENESASQLFCANAKKVSCGCIQNYIIGYNNENEPDINILVRANELLEILERASELKKMKCYDPSTLELKPGKKKTLKIGLGNGHRKSKEFEEYVLTKRVVLRNDFKLCEKASQKILSYSNNFLHKRMKTDPNKGIRVERQKGKAALGKLRPIEDLSLDPCCSDNCVRLALTHPRLLYRWRDRAISGQVEARRVLAEMLTPSGGNRANCYKFISWVTGCSNTTIGKVNEQMKSTGGDREPPEHGLKKYWRDNIKTSKSPNNNDDCEVFVPSYQILQTAVSSAGLTTMMQEGAVIDKVIEPQKKKTRKKTKTPEVKSDCSERIHFTTSQSNNAPSTIKIVDSADTVAAMGAQNSNLTTFPSAVIAVNGQFSNNGFISIPTGLTTESTVPNTISLQAFQQQLQHQQQQQQLQLQIQLLQQQLQNTQNANLAAQAAAAQSLRQTPEHSTAEYIVTCSGIEQTVGTPVVVQTVTTPAQQAASVIQNGLTQNLVHNHESVLPTIFNPSNNNVAEYLTPTANMNNILQALGNQTKVTSNISFMTSPIRNSNELNFLTQNNNPVSISVLNTSTNNIIETSTLTEQRAPQQHVHLIAATQATPTVAAVSQPITLSLQQQPQISFSSLPTMLLTSTTNEQQLLQQPQQLIIQASSNQQIQRPTVEHVVIQRPVVASTQQTNHIPTSQLIVHTSPQSSGTHDIMVSSLLPPINSFNADAFLTNVSSCIGATYTVVNNNSYTNSLSDLQ